MLKSNYTVYKLQNGALVEVGVFSSRSGYSAPARKAATKMFTKARKKRRFRRTIFIRKNGTTSMHKYLVSAKKLKCPKIMVVGGELVEYKTVSHARFKGVIHLE